MAISSINAGMTHTSPNFKGAPKMNAANVSRISSVMMDSANPSKLKQFKNAWNEKLNSIVEKYFTEPVLKPIMNSKFVGDFAEKTKNVDNMPCHMTTAGSIVTTATYAGASLKTLRDSEEQKKRAKTLVLNQVLVTTLSTIGAYTINKKLDNKTKKLSHIFREANQGNPHLDTYMKGFNTAKSLLIFSLMYRYVAPVVVTPLASKLGNMIFNNDVKKPEQQPAKQATVVPMQVAKEMNTQA